MALGRATEGAVVVGGKQRAVRSVAGWGRGQEVQRYAAAGLGVVDGDGARVATPRTGERGTARGCCHWQGGKGMACGHHPHHPHSTIAATRHPIGWRYLSHAAKGPGQTVSG